MPSFMLVGFIRYLASSLIFVLIAIGINFHLKQYQNAKSASDTTESLLDMKLLCELELLQAAAVTQLSPAIAEVADKAKRLLAGLFGPHEFQTVPLGPNLVPTKPKQRTWLKELIDKSVAPLSSSTSSSLSSLVAPVPLEPPVCNRGNPDCTGTHTNGLLAIQIAPLPGVPLCILRAHHQCFVPTGWMQIARIYGMGGIHTFG
jgi:hypothetical protein